MSDSIKAVPQKLAAFFQEHPKIALAFSGGVDSSYLLYAATACGADVCAYFVATPFQPVFEREDVLRMKDLLSAKLTVIEHDILLNETVARNPEDRCYHCKTELMRRIIAHANADGYPYLMDGTNASDDAEDRAGMRALGELRILSPLRLCGVTKADVRALSREAGLFTWDKPAYACLATRIPTGTKIEADMLKRVERAENALFSLGFTDFRVRYAGGAAKIQLPEKQFSLFFERCDAIREALSPDFSDIWLDLRARVGA